MTQPQVAILGAGMIVHDQLLPSLLQLQRCGIVGQITVSARHGRTLQALADSPILKRAFPDCSYRSVPDYRQVEPDKTHPQVFYQVLDELPPRNIVVVALPDQLHYEYVMRALQADQHVICVKPLVLKAEQSEEIEREAFRRGLFVGIEYHKRFDTRSLMARERYRQGLFGEFRLGTAWLMEKWYYRHSNFQNWMTTENSDSFVYIGCHYVDLVHFITGLLPVRVSVYGIRDRFPNGNEGFLWTDARVIWENGACLNVQNSLCYPNGGPGSNSQGMVLYFSGANDEGGFLVHSDQYRGLRYCYIEKPSGTGATQYAEPNPDYFQYVDLGRTGLVPTGYGYRSVEHLIKAAIEVEAAGHGLPEQEALKKRQQLLKELDRSVLATPANSRYNELVHEAGRLSILHGGREVEILYGDKPRVRLVS